MLSIFHISLVIIFFFLSAGVVLFSLIFLFFFAWDFGYINNILPQSYGLYKTIEYATVLLIGLFGINLLGFVFKSKFKSIRRITNNAKLSSPSKNLAQAFKEVRKKMKVRAKLYITNGESLAFAHQLPFRNTVVLNQDFVNSLGEKSNLLKWVIAHELSHIKHNDSLIGGLRLVINDMFVDLFSIRIKFLNLLIRIGNFLNISPFIFKIATSPIFIAFFITRISYKTMKFSFKVIDKSLQRSIEYRADKDATRHIGKAPGIDVLQRLNGASLEPSFDIFATHPATSKRIDRIKNF